MITLSSDSEVEIHPSLVRCLNKPKKTREVRQNLIKNINSENKLDVRQSELERSPKQFSFQSKPPVQSNFANYRNVAISIETIPSANSSIMSFKDNNNDYVNYNYSNEPQYMDSRTSNKSFASFVNKLSTYLIGDEIVNFKIYLF